MRTALLGGPWVCLSVLVCACVCTCGLCADDGPRGVHEGVSMSVCAGAPVSGWWVYTRAPLNACVYTSLQAVPAGISVFVSGQVCVSVCVPGCLCGGSACTYCVHMSVCSHSYADIRGRLHVDTRVRVIRRARRFCYLCVFGCGRVHAYTCRGVCVHTCVCEHVCMCDAC